MRRGTFIAIVGLFVVIAAAAVYQLTLGSRDERLQGPTNAGVLPPVVDSGVVGQLRTSDGGPSSPSAGTIVVFRPGSDTELTEAPIDSDGVFRIALPPGSYRLELRPASAPDATESRTVTVMRHRFTRVDVTIGG